MTVPAHQNQFQLPEFFTVIDDNINEPDQVFAITAEVVPDVPENFTCFQLFPGGINCFGRYGAKRIVIKDNDRK